MGVATDEEIAAALASQFRCQTARDIAKRPPHIANYSFPRDLPEMISADIAMRCVLFPLKMEGNKLNRVKVDVGGSQYCCEDYR